MSGYVYTTPTGLTGVPSALSIPLTWNPSVLAGSAPLALLHFDGNGTDATGNGNNALVNAGVSYEAAQTGFGQAALFASGGEFNGSGPTSKMAQIPISVGGPLDLSTVPNWTIECWLNVTSYGASEANFMFFGVNSPGASQTSGVQLNGFPGSGGQIQMNIQGATSSTNQSPTIQGVAAGVWHHIAMVKQANSGGTGYDAYQLFVDGVGTGFTTTSSGSHFAGPYNTWGGVNGVSFNGQYLPIDSGWFGGQSSGFALDELRVTAACLYTANFTPPTAPFNASGILAPGYDVYRNGVPIATFVGGAGFTDTVPSSGVYTYNVAGWDGISMDISAESAPFVVAIGKVGGFQTKFVPAKAFPAIMTANPGNINPRIYPPEVDTTIRVVPQRPQI